MTKPSSSPQPRFHIAPSFAGQTSDPHRACVLGDHMLNTQRVIHTRRHSERSEESRNFDGFLHLEIPRYARNDGLSGTCDYPACVCVALPHVAQIFPPKFPDFSEPRQHHSVTDEPEGSMRNKRYGYCSRGKIY